MGLTDVPGHLTFPVLNVDIFPSVSSPALSNSMQIGLPHLIGDVECRCQLQQRVSGGEGHELANGHRRIPFLRSLSRSFSQREGWEFLWRREGRGEGKGIGRQVASFQDTHPFSDLFYFKQYSPPLPAAGLTGSSRFFFFCGA